MAKKKFEERPPHIQYIIRQLAMLESPAKIVRDLKNHPEHPADISRSTVTEYRKRHAAEIIEQRRILSAKLPILDVQGRANYLQWVIDKAQAGTEITMPTGASWTKYDFQAILGAIKEVNAMQGSYKKAVDGNQTDEDNFTEEETRALVIQKAFETFVTDNRDIPMPELVKEFMKDYALSQKAFNDVIDLGDYEETNIQKENTE